MAGPIADHRARWRARTRRGRGQPRRSREPPPGSLPPNPDHARLVPRRPARRPPPHDPHRHRGDHRRRQRTGDRWTPRCCDRVVFHVVDLTGSRCDLCRSTMSFMTSSERDAVIRARLARVPEMTAAERERQRESFAFGNVKVDEPDITRNPSVTPRPRR